MLTVYNFFIISVESRWKVGFSLPKEYYSQENRQRGDGDPEKPF